MKSTTLFLLLLGLIAFKAQAEDYHVVYFEQGSHQGKKILTSDHVVTSKAAGAEVLSTYKDLDGNVLYVDRSEVGGDHQIKKVEIEQRQTGTTATVQVKEGKVYYNLVRKGEKPQSADEKTPENFVMSSSLQPFVRDHWKDLTSGKSIEIHFGVWGRLESIRFTLSQKGEEMVGEQKAIVIRMKPTSFLVSAIVNPIYFKFAADGSKMLAIEGRVPALKKSGDSFKDLDAEGVYTY